MYINAPTITDPIAVSSNITIAAKIVCKKFLMVMRACISKPQLQDTFY